MKMQSFERFTITVGETGATFSSMWDRNCKTVLKWKDRDNLRITISKTGEL